MLVAGTMIGSGIFIVSADIARDVGSAGWLLLVWALAGLITIIGALSYAELAAMMPDAGGQYIYLREAFGPLWAFLYGWTLFLVIQTGTVAAVAVAFAKFFGVLVPAWGTDHLLFRIDDLNIRLALPLPWLEEPLVVLARDAFTISAGQVVAVAVLILLTVLNCRGVRVGRAVQNVFTIAKTFALVMLILLGLVWAGSSTILAENFRDPWGAIVQTPRFQSVRQLVPLSDWMVSVMLVASAMVGALFSADSWHNVTFIAGEIKNPRRTLPLSMIAGTSLVITLYLLANVAYLAALPIAGSVDGTAPLERGIAHARDDRVGTAVLELISPRLGVLVMAVAIMVSTFGCVNGLILMGARLYYAMSQDRLFFRSVGQLNQHGVPAAGLIFQCAWASLLVFSGTYSDLLDYVIFAALLFYALTVTGLFVLRWKRPEADRTYRAIGYPWLPGIYIVSCGLIMVDLLIVKPVFTWPGLIIVLSGVPVYWIWKGIRGRLITA
jgi:APA family basic amino acid/polyamine antiporter